MTVDEIAVLIHDLHLTPDELSELIFRFASEECDESLRKLDTVPSDVINAHPAFKAQVCAFLRDSIGVVSHLAANELVAERQDWAAEKLLECQAALARIEGKPVEAASPIDG